MSDDILFSLAILGFSCGLEGEMPLANRECDFLRRRDIRFLHSFLVITFTG